MNAATLQHYWWLGNDIVQKQKEQGWGAKVIDQLSVDLQKRYGGNSGYSARNLGYMKSFATEYPDFPFLQVPLAQITWYHHISMLPKVKDLALRAFYMTETNIQGWSPRQPLGEPLQGARLPKHLLLRHLCDGMTKCAKRQIRNKK